MNNSKLTMRKKYLLPNLGLALIMLIISSTSYSATCQAFYADVAIGTSVEVTVMRDLPLNAKIGPGGSGPTYVYGSNVAYRCFGAAGEVLNIGLSTDLPLYGVINGRNVYATNVPGLGIAIAGSAVSTEMSLSGNETLREPANPPTSYIDGSNLLFGQANSRQINSFQFTKTLPVNGDLRRMYTFRLAVEFYKIGPITSGIFTGKFAELQIGTDGPIAPVGVMSSSGAFQVKTVSCSLNTPAIQVPLADINVIELSGVGRAFKPKAFSVGLNCEAGTRISVTMNGAKNTDTSANGVLQLTNAGSPDVATGVGIQVLYNSTPLVLDNTLALKTSAGGQENLTFTAQYYQTASKVTGGAANSTMTLNITYQ